MKKIVIFIALLLPFLYLLWSVQSANDPIKYIFTCTGQSAIVILMISLSLAPIKKIINLLKYRRMIGLFACFYALLHFLNFYILDAQLDFSFVVKETLDKPFVYLGMISFVILFFMALTSTKKLFAKFNKWHKLVYVVLVLVVIHASMAQKVLSSLEYSFIFIAIILLGYRSFLLRQKFLQK
ncbi:MAG TPA: ferric reductase [Sulfurospirillum arcachonense]|nr:ferric reductase [Sulfurospirillum arcachonense]HIP44364.1 ferric reductase [Sulfurospirillum arcachonense]